MKKRTHIALVLAAAAAALTGCLSREHYVEEMHDDAVEVEVALQDGAYQTRSSLAVTDTYIHDAQLVVTTPAGQIVDVIYTTDVSALSFRGIVGNTYHVWAAANIGSEIPVSVLSDFTDAPRGVDFADISSGGIPMFSDGPVSFTVPSGGRTLPVPVTRMLARVDFSVDRSRLEHADSFEVTGVKLYNAVGTYTPFVSSVKAETGSGSVFDTATATDLAKLNVGYPASFYAFENMQGTLLPGNTDPWAKVPDGIGVPDLCTWLEVTASYEAQGLSTPEVTYRMYLGSDAVTNFDVRRNTIYTVTLIPSEEEIFGDRGSWKIESDPWTDTRGLAFIPDAITVESLGQQTTVLSRTPQPFDFSFENVEWLASVGCTFSYNDATSTVTVTNVVEQDSQTQDYIGARSWDGGLSASCDVTVERRSVPVSIAFTEASRTICVDGPYASLWTDGSPRWTPPVDITWSDGTVTHGGFSLASSDPSVAGTEDDEVYGVSVGTASLSASFTLGDVTVTTESAAAVTVVDPYVGLTLDPDEQGVNIGGSFSGFVLTALYTSGGQTVPQSEATYNAGNPVWEITVTTGHVTLRNATRNNFTPENDFTVATMTRTLSGGRFVTSYAVTVTLDSSAGRRYTNRTGTQYVDYDPEGTLRATYTIGDVSFSATALLYTGEKTFDHYEFQVTPASADLEVGQSETFTAQYRKVYDDGSASQWRDAESSWTTAQGSAVVTPSGTSPVNGSGTAVSVTLTGAANGTDTLTATWTDPEGGTYTASAVINCIQVTYGLVIDPGDCTKSFGDNWFYKAYFVTYHNGEEVSRSGDIRQSCTWSTSDRESVLVNCYRRYPSDVEFTEVTSGPNYNTYRGQAFVTARHNASALITATYVQDDVTYTATSMVTVQNETSSEFRISITNTPMSLCWLETEYAKVVLQVRYTINGTTYGWGNFGGKVGETSSASANGPADISKSSETSYSTGNTSIATVSNVPSTKGLVTAGRMDGETNLYATYPDPNGGADLSARGTVSVNEYYYSAEYEVQVIPSYVTVEVGGSASVSARVREIRHLIYYDGSTGTEYGEWSDDEVFTWSLDDDIASFSQTTNPGESNTFTGLEEGTAQITANYRNGNTYATGTATLAVTAEQALEDHRYELELSKDRLEVQVGKTGELQAYLVDYVAYYLPSQGAPSWPGDYSEDSRTDVTAQCSWSSANTAFVTVSGGTVSGVAVTDPATVAVTATYDDLSASCDVLVFSAPLESITLVMNPHAPDEIMTGGSSVAHVWATYTGVSGQVDVTAEVEAAGGFSFSRNGDSWNSTTHTLTGNSAGTVRVTATLGGMSDYDDVIFYDDISWDLVITPDAAAMVLGDSPEAKFSAILYTTTNGVTDDGYDVTASNATTWSSSDTDVATVGSHTGVITAKAEGASNISAVHTMGTAGSLTAHIAGGTRKYGILTVTAAEPVVTYEHWLEVTPGQATLHAGETAEFTATYYTQEYHDGVAYGQPSSQDVTSTATWTVQSGSSVTLSGAGQYAWASAGTSTVKATYEGESDTAEVICLAGAVIVVDWDELDIWGGNNSYPLQFTYTDEYGISTSVTPTLTSVSISGGAPSSLITYSGGKLRGDDWWGMTGSWTSSQQTYTATFSYGGATCTVSGTFDGHTGFGSLEVAGSASSSHTLHYTELENEYDDEIPVEGYFTGSHDDDFDSYISGQDLFQGLPQGSYYSHNGRQWLDMGHHDLDDGQFSVWDFQCNMPRYITGHSLDVITDVDKLTLSVEILCNSLSIGGGEAYNTGTSTPGAVVIPAGYSIADCSYFVAALFYVDFRGDTIDCNSQSTMPDYAQVGFRHAGSSDLWYEATVDGETATVDYTITYATN